jgi:hypothetical protein
VTTAALREDWLKALTEQAADALGPIADVIVEQAAEEATSFDEVRRRVSAQMEQAARLRFLRATEPLAAEVRRTMGPAKTAATEPRSPAVARPAATTPGTLDRSDPGFVESLARYLATNLGPEGSAMVHEAARRCRTKMQLCMRLASAVNDQALKDMLLRRALD